MSRSRLSRWLFKRWYKAQPGVIADWIGHITHELGEYGELVPAQKTKRSANGREWLPPTPAEYGYRYEDSDLHLEESASRLSLEESEFHSRRAFWNGQAVFSYRHGEAVRFNYGEEWVRAIHDLHTDMLSKQRRAARARRQDV